jgi:hypothetical protein
MRVWLVIAGWVLGLGGCTGSGNTLPGTTSVGRQSKEQCLSAYPERPGNLYQRQICLTNVAAAKESTLSAAQKVIVDDCAKELLSLANNADKAVISLAVYRSQRDVLRAKCSTALAKATPR